MEIFMFKSVYYLYRILEKLFRFSEYLNVRRRKAAENVAPKPTIDMSSSEKSVVDNNANEEKKDSSSTSSPIANHGKRF
uniref:Uncharacterized protein n=1 Tax=Romanomermis culicivorax TaxID=13658 RepID=A0A915JVD1_ROMCU